MSRGSVVPPRQAHEGRQLLPRETVGHVVTDDAVVLGESPAALDGRAEQVVEERVVRRVVPVDPASQSIVLTL